MGTSFCSTFMTSTTGGAPGFAPATDLGRNAPIVRPTTNRQIAPPIQSLCLASMLCSPPNRAPLARLRKSGCDAPRLSRTELPGLELPGGENAQHDEDGYDDKLRDQKRRLGLCRRQRFQRRHSREKLGHQYENIQIESASGGENIGTPP